MIRLVVAVGFLAVFGFVAYALSALIWKQFNKSDKPEQKQENKQ